MIYDKLNQIPADFLKSCRKMPLPEKILMCPPDFFDVIDVKNPHMQEFVGKVDKERAGKQWQNIKESFVSAGAQVECLSPLAKCEDMVFCANQTFPGLNDRGEKICLLAQMKHPSRQKEVPAFADWFKSHAYRVEQLPEQVGFEGGGDAVWHPGRALVWGASGPRSSPKAYEYLSSLFSVPVIRLNLCSEHFYHLDTCFAAIDEKTVIVHSASLDTEGLALVRSLFENVIECDDIEARKNMACNAMSLAGRFVFIQKGNPKTIAALKALSYEVIELDSSEFMKSGGSIYCMKMYVF